MLLFTKISQFKTTEMPVSEYLSNVHYLQYNFYIDSTALRPYKSESTFSYTLSIGCIPYYVQIHLVIKYKTEPTDASEDD